MTDKNRSSRFIWGIVFVIIGGLWLLSNLELIRVEIPDYFFSWQALLILIGLIMLISNHSKTPGIILILIGAYFLIPDIFPWIDHRQIWKLFLPFVLILIGLSLIFRRESKKNLAEKGSLKNGEFDYSASNQDEIKDNTLMGESYKKVISENFKGGKISTVMGKTVIDLRQAKIDSAGATLDISVMMGETIIYAPENVNVDVSIDKFMAGVSDKRPPSAGLQKDRTLAFKGSVFMGNFTIF